MVQFVFRQDLCKKISNIHREFFLNLIIKNYNKPKDKKNDFFGVVEVLKAKNFKP